MGTHTGLRLVLPCTLCSWTPLLCAESLVCARSRVSWLSPPVMSAPPLLYLSPRSSRAMPRLLTLLPSFREISVILLEWTLVLKVWLSLCPRPCLCLLVCWQRRLESTAAPCPPVESAARLSLFSVPSRL